MGKVWFLALPGIGEELMISSISENVAKIVLVLQLFVTKLKKKQPKKCLCACDLCVCVCVSVAKNFEVVFTRSD